MTNAAIGLAAEQSAADALTADGFALLGRRVRTPLGEIDLVACTPSLLVFVEVKCRPTLAQASGAVSPRQQGRLLAAADYLLAEHPDWARPSIRFDVIVVDGAGRLRRIVDAFRQLG